MRILFVTHRTHVPDATGGAQHSMHGLLTGAVEQGHACAGVAALAPGPRLLAFRLLRRAAARRWMAWPDARAGYRVTRTWDFLVPDVAVDVIATDPADLLVLDAGTDLESVGLAAARARGLPTLLRVVDADGAATMSRPGDDGLVRVIVNSRFVAARVAERHGCAADVLYPIVHAARYQVDRPAPGSITFINPRPLKGLDLALQIARHLPHRQFQFVESWPLTRAQWAMLQNETAGCGNVRLVRRTHDLRPIYADTQLLIVPSLCEEAFGRVVLEAQASGIPVIARDVGGLAEALGAGGVLLDRDAGADRWAGEIEGLLRNRSRLSAISAEAARHAVGPAFTPSCIVREFLHIAAIHAANSRV